MKSEISSVKASLHASIRCALVSARSKDATTPCWPTRTIVRAVCSKALSVKVNIQSHPIQHSTSASNEEKNKFCTPLELVYAFPDDSVAALGRCDALQPVDDELTSPDESRATCLAGFHFGISLMHKLHCSIGCAQGYTAHR